MISDNIKEVLSLYKKLLYTVENGDEVEANLFVDYCLSLSNGESWKKNVMELTNFQKAILKRLEKEFDKLEVDFIRTPSKSNLSINDQYGCIGSIVGNHLFSYDKEMKTALNKIIWFMVCYCAPDDPYCVHMPTIYHKIAADVKIKSLIQMA